MKEIFRSLEVPGDGVTAPYCFVLSEVRDGEWATHLLNLQDGGKYHGHYKFTYEDAVQDFELRVARDIADRYGYDVVSM